MGLRRWSMSAASVPSIKELARHTALKVAEEVARRVLSMKTTGEIRGSNGVVEASPGYQYFYTTETSDDTLPTVRTVTPPAGAIGIGDNARIVVRFSEPVNPLTTFTPSFCAARAVSFIS